MRLPQRVLCLGEALVDVVQQAGTEHSAEHVGGSLLNVACVLARLGHKTEIAAWWGKDRRGKALADYLKNHGVNIVPGCDQAAYTSCAEATLDDEGRASYLFDLLWEVPALPGAEMISHLHTGSIAAVLEPGGSAVLRETRKIAQYATVSLDPNVRPAIMKDADQARARFEQLISLADVVKASDEDLEWLYPEQSVPQIMRRWLASGPGLVVVTRGAQGAWAVLKAERDMIMIDPLDVQRADTVGAGDSFMGGLLSGLLSAGLLGSVEAKARLRQAHWAEILPALHRATITSGLTVSHHGAYAPQQSEIETVLLAHPELA